MGLNGTDDGAFRTAKMTTMLNPATERNRIEAKLADGWWRAQHLVWHTPAWVAEMVAIDDFQRDLRRINRLSLVFDELPIPALVGNKPAGQQDPQ